MSWFNFGGPGWFNDVFEIDIVLDESSRKISLKGFLLEQTVSLYGTSERIQGKLKIRAPPGRTSSHNGIQIELESSLQFYESLNSIALSTEETITEVAPPGSITGEVEIDFVLDLAKMQKERLLDTYDGEKFDVRHSLLVTMKRPWYTFNVTRNLTLAIQHVQPAPVDQSTIAVPAQLAVVPREPTIVIDDCGGRCVFSYGKMGWNLGEVLEGSLVFEPGLTQVLVSVKLVLYKIEMADGDTTEKTIKELALILPPAAVIPEDDGAAAPAVIRRDPVSPAGETLSVSFPLVESELSPTYAELNPGEADNVVNVHYYLRLVVESEESKKFWNTHEIILFRAQISKGISPANDV